MALPTRRVLQVFGMLVALFAATACGRQEGQPSAAASAAQAAPAPAPASVPARVYVVATDAVYAPFESHNDRGEIVGFDVDVLKAVAARAGIEVAFVNTPWEGIFKALRQGERDLIASAVTITPERAQAMDFSQPYFEARQLLAVRKDSKVSALLDLAKLKVGVQTGTSGDELATQLLGRTSPAVKRFDTTPLALQALGSGAVDAVLGDNGVVLHYLVRNPGAGLRSVADPALAAEPYAIAVKKGDSELLGKIDRGLAAIKADGSLAALHMRYFGAPAQ